MEAQGATAVRDQNEAATSAQSSSSAAIELEADSASPPPSNCYFLPSDELSAAQAKAEAHLQSFAQDFRHFWEVVSNKEASVDMVDACLKGAYQLGITKPQYRAWLPLSKIGETMAILHIMRCNLCLNRGELSQAVHDAQVSVSLTTVPGSSQCCPKATSGMWFAQACRALGRVCVRTGNSLRASEFLGHAINVLKEDGKADASAVDMLLWRVMGHCWPLPGEPEYSPIDTNLLRMEHPPEVSTSELKHEAAPRDSGMARDFCKSEVWTLPGGTLDMYKFSYVQYGHYAILFGGMFVSQPPQPGKASCINSVIRINLNTLSHESIKTQGEDDAPKRPHPREGHRAVLHGDSMFVIGGEADPSHRDKGSARSAAHWGNLLWRLDLLTWRWHRIQPKGELPCVRYDACAVQSQGTMFLFGGRCTDGLSHADGTKECGDLWALDLSNYTWTCLSPEPEPRQICQPASAVAPEPRHSATMWCWGNSLFVHGGAAQRYASECTFGDLWRYTLDRKEWSPVQTRGNPPAARSEAMIACLPNGNAFLCGGYSTSTVCAAPEAANGTVPMDLVPATRRLMYQSAYMHDAFELDRVSLTWRQLRRQDCRPILSSARAAGAAFALDGKLIVFGGYLGMMPDKLIPGDGNTVHWWRCQRCGAHACEDGTPLLMCAGCAVAGCTPAGYCSAACQEQDWMKHRHWCSGSYPTPD